MSVACYFTQGFAPEDTGGMLLTPHGRDRVGNTFLSAQAATIDDHRPEGLRHCYFSLRRLESEVRGPERLGSGGDSFLGCVLTWLFLGEYKQRQESHVSSFCKDMDPAMGLHS